MPKTSLIASAQQAHCRAQRALLQRARDFMRARQALVTDPECLPGMIMACIAEGARTRDDIVRNVPRFVGHSYAEVASTLDRFCGPAVHEHYWYRDEAKAYHLHFTSDRIEPPVELRTKPRVRAGAKSSAIKVAEPTYDLF